MTIPICSGMDLDLNIQLDLRRFRSMFCQNILVDVVLLSVTFMIGISINDLI